MSNKQEGWKERFREQFGAFTIAALCVFPGVDMEPRAESSSEDIKDFIEKEITTARKEEREKLKAELREMFAKLADAENIATIYQDLIGK